MPGAEVRYERAGGAAVLTIDPYDGLGLPLADGLAVEARNGAALTAGAAAGAARFAAGEGRGGGGARALAYRLARGSPGPKGPFTLPTSWRARRGSFGGLSFGGLCR